MPPPALKFVPNAPPPPVNKFAPIEGETAPAPAPNGDGCPGFENDGAPNAEAPPLKAGAPPVGVPTMEARKGFGPPVICGRSP